VNSPSTNSSKWFVCPQVNAKAETRLFLFPYAGAGPAVFGTWIAELPDRLEGYVAHYPGRGSRHNEPPLKRLAALVDGLAQSIQPLLDKPFALFGHSLGGLAAFELARRLRQNQLPQPTVLFISACRAPHIPDPHAPIHGLSDPEFLQSLQQLNGIPSGLLDQPDAIQLLLPILRADFEAVESHPFNAGEPPLDCPILVFGGLDDPRVSRDHLKGWSLHTNSRFESQHFPGDHFFINNVKDSIIETIAASSDGKK